DVLLARGQAVEHPGSEQLVDRAVDDGRRDARIDLHELSALDAALDHPRNRIDRLREVADPLGQLGTAAELADHDSDDVGQVEPRAQDDRGDVAELVGCRLIRLLHARDPREEQAPVVMEDRFENLVLRLEVVVEEPVGGPGLLGDVADPARVEALAREYADSSVEKLPPLLLTGY